MSICGKARFHKTHNPKARKQNPQLVFLGDSLTHQWAQAGKRVWKKRYKPRNAVNFPWRLNQEYVIDRKQMKEDPVNDGLLVFARAGANARDADEQLEAAE